MNDLCINYYNKLKNETGTAFRKCAGFVEKN